MALKRKDVENIINKMSQSSGMYYRFKKEFEKNPTKADAFYKLVESKEFSDPIELIMWIEC